MTKKYSEDIHDYVEPFYINGLEGRMLKASTKTSKKLNILYVYDVLDSLENSWGMIENLRNYGNVTSVDMPGIGGMTSFSKIDNQISIDAYADYLAAFIKLRFKHQKITMVAKGFGFVAITRMLLKYPALSKKMKMIVNIAGEIHRDDIQLSQNQIKALSSIYVLLSFWPLSSLSKVLLKNDQFIRHINSRFDASYFQMLLRFNDFLTFNEHKKILNSMHMPTYWRVMNQLNKLDNCTKRIDIPLKHAYFKKYGLINYATQKQHMMITYKNYRSYEIKLPENNTGSARKDASYLLPSGLKRVLSSAKA